MYYQSHLYILREFHHILVVVRGERRYECNDCYLIQSHYLSQDQKTNIH